MKYLSSYRPLAIDGRGRSAIQKFGFPPFVDYSCRREPDFESKFPSITALCRGSKFAPRLNESDIVVYMTVKRKYPGYSFAHRRLTAILRVIRRFESHRLAASWYQDCGLGLPSNCMVAGNHPLELDRARNLDNFNSIEQWDTVYRCRSERNGVFLVCDSLFLNLWCPPVIEDGMLTEVFGKVPGTQNPPSISDQEYSKVAGWVGVSYASARYGGTLCITNAAPGEHADTSLC